MADPEITSYSQYESEEPVEAHDGGEFFSSVLWALRDSMDTGQLDFLVYDALHKEAIPANPTFLDLRDGLITADHAAYGGSHESTIYNTFADAGIVAPLNVYVNGPHRIPAGSISRSWADVSGGFPPYHYQWYRDGGSVGTDSSRYQFQTLPSDDGRSFHISATITDNHNNTVSDDYTVLVTAFH